MEEEDDLLQFAIQQSLIDAGTEREEVTHADLLLEINFEIDFCLGGYLGGVKSSTAFEARHAKLCRWWRKGAATVTN